jgi:hypothetical protein
MGSSSAGSNLLCAQPCRAAPAPPPGPRQVSLEEGDAKARELAVNFIETSAKAGFNIKVGSRTGPNGQAVSVQATRDTALNAVAVAYSGSATLPIARRASRPSLAFLQALFRKIAAALPGMDSSGNTGAAAADGVNVQLTPATVQLTKPAPPPSACAC